MTKDRKPTYEALEQRISLLEKESAQQRRFEEINRTLFKISNAVNMTSNLDDLFRSIHLALSPIIDTANFYIALYDSARDSVTFPYCVDQVDGCYPPVIEVSRTASLTAEVIRTGRPVLVSKAEILIQRSNSSLKIPACTPSEIWLGVPLKSREAIIGVMSVQSYHDPMCYDQTDMDVMVSVAEQVSIAVERKLAEDALEKRLAALTCPLDHPAEIMFEELFDLAAIQRIQDEFAAATGVASIITHPDGSPITRPSNFCRLCEGIIRCTEKGRLNCYRSDALLGRHHPDGPIIQPCLSGGLWDAGASITVGDRHIANWLIGQVRDATQNEEKMAEYARVIGADEAAVIEAFRDVPAMSLARFTQVAQALFTLANQLSTTAYQNVRQARFIAEHKRAEQEKIRLEAQLQQAQKMEAIGSLAGGIAHDLNNILFPISGLSEMLLEEIPPGNPTHERLEQILKSAQRGSALVKKILAFSRQSNPQKLPIRIQPILKEALDLARAIVPKNIEITSHIETDCGMVSADPTQVHQVMMNLITNAYHAVAENGGSIRIALKATNITPSVEKDKPPFHAIPGDILAGRYACITVSDTGSGIPETLIDRIFTPYFTTKALGKGTGLGLSVVHGIVKEHGGDIRVYSQLGKGTAFHVYLPLLEDATSSKDATVSGKYPTGCESVRAICHHYHGGDAMKE